MPFKLFYDFMKIMYFYFLLVCLHVWTFGGKGLHEHWSPTMETALSSEDTKKLTKWISLMLDIYASLRKISVRANFCVVGILHQTINSMGVKFVCIVGIQYPAIMNSLSCLESFFPTSVKPWEGGLVMIITMLIVGLLLSRNARDRGLLFIFLSFYPWMLRVAKLTFYNNN